MHGSKVMLLQTTFCTPSNLLSNDKPTKEPLVLQKQTFGPSSHCLKPVRLFHRLSALTLRFGAVFTFWNECGWKQSQGGLRLYPLTSKDGAFCVQRRLVATTSYKLQQGWRTKPANTWIKLFFLVPTRQPKLTRLINPLWGQCQEYKIERNAILQERLLTEKRSTFADCNLTFSESFCLTDYEKQKSKSSWHTEKFAKNHFKRRLQENAYIAPKLQSL